MRPLRTIAFAATLAAASACGGCGTLRSTSEWVVSPVVQTAAPGVPITEECENQRPRVAPAASDRKIRIGSWNMLYLGPSEKTPQEKRDPRTLASYLRLAKVSVLALQEIGVRPGTSESRNPTLDAMFAELGKDGADWTYLLHGTMDDPNQLVGLAWDRRVLTQVGEPVALSLTGDAPGPLPLLSFIRPPVDTKLWIHPPFAVKLSAGPGLTDLVFVPCHLTARVETYFFEDATAHREAESELLAKVLPRVEEHFHDKDVVVLGDFNTEVGTERISDTMNERGWRDLNCAGLTTYRLGMALDHVFVPMDQPEFGLDPDFARVVPPDMKSWSDFVDRYSDHLMVVADVRVTRDDD